MMKKTLLVCCVMAALVTLAFAGTIQKAEPILTTTAPMMDQKVGIERLTTEIMTAKNLGLTPDPVLYTRLADLMTRPRRNNLDQGADACPATVIPSLPYMDTGTTTDYVNDPDMNCVGMSSANVIYELTPVETGDHTISLCGSSYDTGLAIRTTGSCPGSDLVACNDDACGLQSEIIWSLNAGQTYWIVVHGYGTNSGDYVLNVTGPAPAFDGDVCAAALPLSVPGMVAGSTTTFNHDYDFACPYTGSTSKDVVYTYTPAQNEQVTFDLCVGNTNYDTKLYIYAGVCENPPAYCNDDACTSPGGTSFVSRLECVDLFAGTQYFIVVDGYGGSNGDYTLEATVCEACEPIPPNDNCANAMPMVVNGEQICATTECATLDCELNDFAEVWYTFELIECMDVAVSYCGTTTSGSLNANLFSGSCCGTYIDYSSYEYDTCPDGLITLHFLNLAAGQYWLPVGFDPAGPFCVQVTGVACPPPPPCVDMTLAAPGSISGNTVGAGDNCTANAGPEQVVEVIIPYDGEWTFSLCGGGTDYDSWLDLATECCGAPFVSNDDYCGLQSEIHCIPLTAGTYYLAVEGFSLNTGNWGLDVTACTPPPCVPTPLVAFLDTPLPQSACATICPNEPVHITIVASDGQFDPSEVPIVTIAAGCDVELTDCDEECEPAAEWNPFEWVFDDYCWHGYLTGGPGCVCITLEGFLGIELNSFSALAGDGQVSLTWVTASESNNSRFDILRNSETVGQVEATNNAGGSTYHWTDRNVTNGTTYTYTLVAVDVNGNREEVATTAATPTLGSAVVTEYALHQNYPNPFNPSTSITFDLLESGLTTVKVYDLMGREIATLVNSNLSQGRHTVSFDAAGLPSGMYLYKLNVNDFTAQHKMLLLK